MSKLTTFKNGLRLVTEKIEGMYSVALGIWVGAGSSDENNENNGISHFIEHMLFKGTKRRTAFEITDAIDRIGAQINAFTSKECTCYYTKSTREYTEKTFDILSDMLFHSKFDSEEIKKEKGVVLEEISMVEDTPEDVCIDLLANAYFKEHALGRPIIGTSKNVSSFTKADIKAYMDRMYTPNNIVIAVAGNIDEQEIIALTEQYFANGFHNEAPLLIDRAQEITPTPDLQKKFKTTEQSHIAIAFKSLPYAAKGMETDVVIASVLGGGMSSRLFQTVREQKGLAYAVYSYISTYKNNGMLMIYAAVNPKSVADCAKTIREEIDKLIAGGITEEEFLRGKAQLKGSFEMSQEQTSTVMNMCGKYLLMADKVYDVEKKLKDIEAVNYEDVSQRLKTFFDFSTVCASYAGPEIEDFDILSYFTEKK